MKFFIIGCGPGSLNYFLFKSAKLIVSSKIIFYESLVNLNLLNLSLNFNIKLLIGKRFNQKSIFKKTIYLNFFLYFIKYRFILILKSGDLNIFSRINNEALYLNSNKISYILISGLTSIENILNKISFILSFRFNLSSIIFVTYLNSNLDIKYDFLFSNKTIIYYMVNNNFNYILEYISIFNYYKYILLIESSSYFFEHVFIFDINDLIYNNIYFYFFSFIYPRLILMNYFLIFLKLKNFFIKIF